jgi:ribosome recycling factor
MSYDFKQFETRLGEIEEWLKGELSTIRTGRATATLLDGVKVESYGSQLPMNQVATVVSEDARTLRITPYDQSQIQEIEKAINDADLGVSVNTDEKGLRVIFPELTAERRDILMKQAGKKLEEARISIRKERDDTWNNIQNQEKSGEISEDDKFKMKEEMEKRVEDAQSKFEDLVKAKEEEIQV